MTEQERMQSVRQRMRNIFWLRLVLTVVLLLPLLILLALPAGTLTVNILWFWLMLLVLFGAAWFVLHRSARSATLDDVRPLDFAPDAIREVMDVKVAAEESGVQIFRGRLLEPASIAYEKLKAAFANQAVPLIQEDQQLGATIMVMPKPVEKEVMERRTHIWVNWLLFFATFLTTTWAGAAHQGVNLLSEPGRFVVGLPYSLGLLAILGVHELGHFFAARHHGMDVTPPYFIPVPFALGTFGAFIKMRSPSEDRRSLFDVAVAGPLAGLVVAIPALLIGLHQSTVVPGVFAASQGPLSDTSPGSSILFAILAKIALGPALLQGGVLRLSPLAFAGWLGLVITALNLLPIGQLDGGHTARAMFGTRIGRGISHIAMWALFLLALFVWPSLMPWAIIVFFLAGNSIPPMNDMTRLTPGRFWLGCVTFIILASILMPLPQSWWDAFGLYRPPMPGTI